MMAWLEILEQWNKPLKDSQVNTVVPTYKSNGAYITQILLCYQDIQAHTIHKDNNGNYVGNIRTIFFNSIKKITV